MSNYKKEAYDRLIYGDANMEKDTFVSTIFQKQRPIFDGLLKINESISPAEELISQTRRKTTRIRTRNTKTVMRCFCLPFKNSFVLRKFHSLPFNFPDKIKIRFKLRCISSEKRSIFLHLKMKRDRLSYGGRAGGEDDDPVTETDRF